jgi:hypothetical protein
VSAYLTTYGAHALKDAVKKAAGDTPAGLRAALLHSLREPVARLGFQLCVAVRLLG